MLSNQLFFIHVESPLSEPIMTGKLDFLHKRRSPSKGEKVFKFWQCWGRRRERLIGEMAQDLLKWNPIILALRPNSLSGAGEENRPQPASLVGYLAPQVGRSRAGTFSLLLHYFIKLLTNKHMETIHSWALIAFSFRGMAGPGLLWKITLIPHWHLTQPHIFQSLLVMLLRGIWLLFPLHEFAHSVHFCLFLCPWGRLTAELTSIIIVLNIEATPAVVAHAIAPPSWSHIFQKQT